VDVISLLVTAKFLIDIERQLELIVISGPAADFSGGAPRAAPEAKFPVISSRLAMVLP